MECAYYFVDGTWNVPTTLTFVGCVLVYAFLLLIRYMREVVET